MMPSIKREKNHQASSHGDLEDCLDLYETFTIGSLDHYLPDVCSPLHLLFLPTNKTKKASKLAVQQGATLWPRIFLYIYKLYYYHISIMLCACSSSCIQKSNEGSFS